MQIRLLVVDDEVEVCDFVKNFFNERNFEVFTAYNGKEALNIIEIRNPQIVLLDVKMPIMDGMETLREMRRREKDCKVIMLTAVEDSKMVEEAKEYGVLEYITKPLSLEQLEQLVFSAAEQIKSGAPGE